MAAVRCSGGSPAGRAASSSTRPSEADVVELLAAGGRASTPSCGRRARSSTSIALRAAVPERDDHRVDAVRARRAVGRSGRDRVHAAGAVGRARPARVAGVAADVGRRPARRVHDRRVRRRGHADRPAPDASSAAGEGCSTCPGLEVGDDDPAVQPAHDGDPGRRRAPDAALRATVGDVVATKDGYVGFAVVNRVQHWLDFCAMVGRPEWADDRTLDNVVDAHRAQRRAEPGDRGVVRRAHDGRDRRAGRRCCASRASRSATARRSRQMDHFASEPFYDVNPDGGFLQPAPPFRMHPPIPGVGEVRAGAAARPADPRRAAAAAGSRPGRRSPARGTRPFEGLRVADFTSFWAGPFLGHVLGMFGADVIHVESTGPARRGPADEPPPADRGRSGGSARRTSTPRTPTSAASRSTCRSDGRAASWPAGWSPSAT